MSAATLSIALPYPPSVNRLWRIRGKGMYLDKRYTDWKRVADIVYLAHKREWKPVVGHFTAVLVLNEKRRLGDADNRIKPVLDWLQRVELIEDDKLCDALSVSYGHAPEGVRISLYPVADARRAA